MLLWFEEYTKKQKAKVRDFVDTKNKEKKRSKFLFTSTIFKQSFFINRYKKKIR